MIDGYVWQIRNLVSNMLGEGFEVSVSEIFKNNDQRKLGLSIRARGANISPNIYISDIIRKQAGHLEDGITADVLSALAEKVVEIYEKHKCQTPFDTSLLDDFDRVKDRIEKRLVNRKMNEFLLKNHIWKPFLDMAIIYVVNVSDLLGDGSSSFKITHAMAAHWNKAIDEIDEIAKVPDADIKSMADMLRELNAPEFMIVETPDIFVCSNKSKLFGANVILSEEGKKEIVKMCGNKDVYIIPSSIHELLAVPSDNGFVPSELTDMICSVNAKEVSADEVLSTHPYLLHAATLEVTAA